jgi:hypothetical protein
MIGPGLIDHPGGFGIDMCMYINFGDLAEIFHRIVIYFHSGLFFPSMITAI